MLLVNFMIIQFVSLKLDRFYCIRVMNYKKRFFLLTWWTNVLKWVINGFTGKKSCKKQNKDILKKKLLSIIHKTKKQ